MEICWNCGHDREGVAHPTVFDEPVEVDLTVCGACGYSLKGNPDAQACPECGEPVPWQDCAACGVRASRMEMQAGCPACRAMRVGEPFKSELDESKQTDLTDDQVYQRSKTRCGLTSIVIATCLLPIGFILEVSIGQGFCCVTAVASLGLYAHGFIGMAQKRALAEQAADDIA